LEDAFSEEGDAEVGVGAELLGEYLLALVAFDCECPQGFLEQFVQ